MRFQYWGADRLRRKDKHFRNADPLAGAVASPFWPTGRPDRSSVQRASHPGTRPRSALPAQVYSQPLRPERGSFFKSRDRLRILCGVQRAGADMREAKPLELATNSDCRQIDAELGPKDTLQVHASPAAHAMLLRIGAGLHQLPPRLLLLHRQLRPTTHRFHIDDSDVGGFSEPLPPVPHLLPTHP